MTAAVIAPVLGAVISGGFQYMGQQKAARAADKRASQAAAARAQGEALEARKANLTAMRQRRRAAAESRRLRATAVNTGANRGFGGAIGQQGSTIAGFQGSIQSQLNYNNAFINQVTSLNAGIRSAFGQADTITRGIDSAGTGLFAFGKLVGSSAFGKLSKSFVSSNTYSSQGLNPSFKPTDGEGYE
jgi:hypothetical protein|tara:strand:- start:5467 stop:6027 length:561 start_codon:yes stop_codon:yes gene_type:complete